MSTSMPNAKEKHFWDETRKPWMDLENERDPIRPLKSGKASNRANEHTGQANRQMAGFFQDIVMEKAMKDRYSQITRIETPEVSSDVVPEISLLDGDDDLIRSDFGTVAADSVEQDEDIDSIRVRRMEEMKRVATMQNHFKALGHGTYTEIVETEFLNSVIKSERAVVHFYHLEFAKCKVVDQRLGEAASYVLGCRFLKVNAEKCPFFVNKLQIQVLPTILYFVNGKAVHRVIGFSEFNGVNDFSLGSLVRSLRRYKMTKGSDEIGLDKLMGGRTNNDFSDAEGGDRSD